MGGTAADTIEGPRGATTITVDRSWWSEAGAHGGYLAAAALTAMRARLGSHADPGTRRPVRALTTRFLTPVDDRPLDLTADVERAGRGASAASVSGEQDGAVVVLGSAIFGSSRPGEPRHDGVPAPTVPAAGDCAELTLPVRLAAYARHLEIRPATPARPLGGGDRAELVAWMRFTDGRPLDAEAVVVLTDAMPPALFALWTEPRPVPTAELTVHFGDALDEGPADDWALVRIRGEHAGSGWAVDDSVVWAADGRLLAMARQARRILAGPA